MYLLRELCSFDFHEASSHSFHEALLVAISNTSGANRILVSVSVDASVDHTPKQVVHNVSKDICRGNKE